MDRRMTRRSFIKMGSYLFGGLLLSPFAGYAYSRYLEPHILQIKHLSLTFPRLPQAFSKMRLVQFSDIHLDFHYGLKRLNHLINTIKQLKPDMLCFTGDLYDTSVGLDGDHCAELLSRLEAPLGKWAVLGNHDYISGKPDVVQVLEKGGFTVLTNRAFSVKRGGTSIQIVGIDSVLMGKPDLQTALQSSREDDFKILLAHEPDYADIAVRFPIDLQLSGHSHGGQVRIPFYGHLFAPEYAIKYSDGLYVLKEGQFHVYTNRGIGVSTYPIRFWCRPEITVFTLQ